MTDRRLVLASVAVAILSLGFAWTTETESTSQFVPQAPTVLYGDFTTTLDDQYIFNPGFFVFGVKSREVLGMTGEMRMSVPVVAFLLWVAARRRSLRLARLALAAMVVVFFRYLFPDPLTPGKLVYAVAVLVAAVAVARAASAPAVDPAPA